MVEFNQVGGAHQEIILDNWMGIFEELIFLFFSFTVATAV